jgi:hypothetical protein
MPVSSRLARPRTRRAALAAVAALTTSTVAFLSAPTAVSATDPDCPPAVPVADIVAGDAVHGLTGAKGNTPETFTGEVLGVIDDGIAADLDMVMVRLTSPEIDRVGGIWAGMSGSPVYAADGDLIGAVAYGLAGTTPVAGVTPAEEMYKLLASPPTTAAAAAAARGADQVDIPKRLANRMVSEGVATRTEVDAGAGRLPTPVAVSGLTPKRYAKLVERSKLDDVRYFRGGKTAGLAPGDPADIVPGGNLATTLSYGDLTYGGIGTTTAVCGSEVLAFGHPMMFSRTSTLTMHTADAVYVQEDKAWVPFKVANITGTVGNITDDRLAAVNGEIGPLPPTAEITSRVDMTGGSSRTGTTNSTVPDWLPDIATFGHLANLDRVVDGYTDGTARVRWIVRGTKPNGAPFTLDRTDRFASASDITFESIFEPWDQLFALQYFENGMPTITDVDFRAQVDDRLRAFRINSVDARQGGQWVRVRRGGNLVVKAGTDLRLRMNLTSLRGLAGTKSVQFEMRVPGSLAGRRGFMQLTGGNEFFEDCFEFGCEPSGGSFDQLLRQLDTQVRNDAVVGTLGRFEFSRAWKQKNMQIGDVLDGWWGANVRIVR